MYIYINTSTLNNYFKIETTAKVKGTKFPFMPDGTATTHIDTLQNISYWVEFDVERDKDKNGCGK